MLDRRFILVTIAFCLITVVPVCLLGLYLGKSDVKLSSILPLIHLLMLIQSVEVQTAGLTQFTHVNNSTLALLLLHIFHLTVLL